MENLIDFANKLWSKIQAQPAEIPQTIPTPKSTDESSIFFAYFALLAMAVLPIVVGSHASVPRDTDKEEGEREVFTAQDAKAFPLIGSISLFTLYIVFTYLNKDYVNLLLTVYFSLLGVGALVKTMLLVGEWFLGREIVAGYKLALFDQGHGKSSLSR
jgi:minor histocompatibility antigen H13